MNIYVNTSYVTTSLITKVLELKFMTTTMVLMCPLLRFHGLKPGLQYSSVGR
jgi:hypothetical protein